MDDALVQDYLVMSHNLATVLILVVMDDALVQSNNFSRNLILIPVLILVVMDDALVLD